MKNLFTPEDLTNPISADESLQDTIKFYKLLESENDGATNDGFNTVEEALRDITEDVEYSQNQANSFFSLALKS